VVSYGLTFKPEMILDDHQPAIAGPCFRMGDGEKWEIDLLRQALMG
jgi:hypothetical protein